MLYYFDLGFAMATVACLTSKSVSSCSMVQPESSGSRRSFHLKARAKPVTSRSAVQFRRRQSTSATKFSHSMQRALVASPVVQSDVVLEPTNRRRPIGLRASSLLHCLLAMALCQTSTSRVVHRKNSTQGCQS